MARMAVVTIVDDLDGSERAEAVTFGFDGQDYEIDLSMKNLDQFTNVLGPFIEAGCRVGRPRTTTPSRTRTSKSDSSTVRAWAAAQGRLRD